VLVADWTSYRRAARLQYVPMPGGDAAARFPWRMALSFLHRAYGEALFDLPVPFVRDLDRSKAHILVRMAAGGIHSPMTSSCGRLFDAVSALLGIRSENRYEGQAPVELEMVRVPGKAEPYPWEEGDRDGVRVLGTDPLIRAIVEELVAGTAPGVISSRFHHTLIRMFCSACKAVREETGLGEVAMSGGAFQNVTLLTGLTRELRQEGFTVYTHTLVPSNDGGISLGQAVCAAVQCLKGSFPASLPSAPPSFPE